MYEVHDLGWLLTSDARQRIERRFWAKVDRSGGPYACWPWLGGRSEKGYGRFTIQSGLTVRSNRLAFTFANGADPGDALACHSCDNPPCCNPGHLWAGDHDANRQDCIRKGRAKIAHLRRAGRSNPRAVLTEVDVIEILVQIMAGDTNKEIAEHYGVTHSDISAIRRGKAWAEFQAKSKVPRHTRYFRPYASIL